MGREIEYSGITVPLPGGSYEVSDLRKQLDNATSLKDEAKRPGKIADAIEKTLAPVEVDYQDEPVKRDIFGRGAFVPDGHELAEVEGLDGVKREMAVPKRGNGDNDANANTAAGGAAAIGDIERDGIARKVTSPPEVGK